MAKKKNPPIEHNGGYIRVKKKHVKAFVVSYFNNEESARAWIDKIVGADSEGATGKELVVVALTRLIVEKTQLGRREVTIQNYRQRIRKLIRDHPDGISLRLEQLDANQIKSWLTTCGYQGKTWNSYRGVLHSFFEWCKREGMIKVNPVAGIPLASYRRKAPVCMAVSHVALFMSTCARVAPDLVPYFALGFFAGIRTAELERMDHTCLREGSILVGAEQAKIGQQRFITIMPNLGAWLAKFPLREGPLTVSNQRERFEVIVGAAKDIDPDFFWPHNAMRHSFASYHLAAFKNSALTSHELGHLSTNLLFNTYRSLCTSEEGERYFAIHPE